MAAHDPRVIVREKEMREQQTNIHRDRLRGNNQEFRVCSSKRADFILLCFVDRNTMTPKVTSESISNHIVQSL